MNRKKAIEIQGHGCILGDYCTNVTKKLANEEMQFMN